MGSPQIPHAELRSKVNTHMGSSSEQKSTQERRKGNNSTMYRLRIMTTPEVYCTPDRAKSVIILWYMLIAYIHLLIQENVNLLYGWFHSSIILKAQLQIIPSNSKKSGNLAHSITSNEGRRIIGIQESVRLDEYHVGSLIFSSFCECFPPSIPSQRKERVWLSSCILHRGWGCVVWEKWCYSICTIYMHVHIRRYQLDTFYLSTSPALRCFNHDPQYGRKITPLSNSEIENVRIWS